MLCRRTPRRSEHYRVQTTAASLNISRPSRYFGGYRLSASPADRSSPAPHSTPLAVTHYADLTTVCGSTVSTVYASLRRETVLEQTCTQQSNLNNWECGKTETSKWISAIEEDLDAIRTTQTNITDEKRFTHNAFDWKVGPGESRKKLIWWEKRNHSEPIRGYGAKTSKLSWCAFRVFRLGLNVYNNTNTVVGAPFPTPI